MKILILDDHPPIVEFVAIKLRELNGKLVIFHATTVEQALFHLEEQDINRVICDLQINNGKNMVIPNHCCRNNIPFMVYSSHVNFSLIKELKAFNISCYVSKGSKTECLMEGLDKLLQNQTFFCPEVSHEQTNVNSSDVPRPNLTTAEYKVVQAYASGMNTHEVAEHLGLKIVTVRNHRARATEKNLSSFIELLERFKYWED